jgi:Skp family chaperone for outer membrane proteins
MQLRPIRFATLLALLSVFAAVPAFAQWKWVDASGKVQYSDRPPPAGTPDKDILQRPYNASRQPIVVTTIEAAASAAAARAASAAPASSAPNRAEQEQSSRQKLEREQQVAKQKEEERRLADQRRDNCARAQENLRTLQATSRLVRANEKGEKIFLDESQRDAEMQRARQLISSECR